MTDGCSSRYVSHSPPQRSAVWTRRSKVASCAVRTPSLPRRDPLQRLPATLRRERVDGDERLRPPADAAAELATLPPLPGDRQLLVHTGALSGPRGRDARPLLEALRRLADEPPIGSRLMLVQAGPTQPGDEPLLADLRQRGVALTLGVVPRPSAIALQRRAAVLMLLTSAEVSQSTGKLYEYLAADRPISPSQKRTRRRASWARRTAE